VVDAGIFKGRMARGRKEEVDEKEGKVYGCKR